MDTVLIHSSTPVEDFVELKDIATLIRDDILLIDAYKG